MKILMTGATGWVGHTLGIDLVRRGHQLVCLVRDPASAKLNCPFPAEWVHWPSAGAPLEDAVFSGVDAVLHLAGEPVASARWNPEIKGRIRASRVESARMLAEKVRSFGIAHYISASAIGFYGDRGEEELSESSVPGKGFLADVCRDWEGSVFAAQDVSRCVAVRIGIVLGRGGGALEKMLPPFRLGLGGSLGSGRQWMSWIHLGDLKRLLIDCIENDKYRGAVNATAPKPVPQKEFARLLGELLRRPAIVPAPANALKIMLGEMSAVVLASQKVLPNKTAANGFHFDYPDLSVALHSLLEPERENERRLVVQQYVARPLEEVFPFYSDERNLERITPPFLKFRVLGKNTAMIESGTLIDYRLRLHGVPFEWRTKILDWQPPELFVDTQLKGPYRKWHHTHRFERLGSGTLISDEVRYRLPFGAIGSAVAGWKVDSDVKSIFNFRRQVIAKEIWP